MNKADLFNVTTYMNPVSIPELWQDNKANTHTHLLDLSEQFSGSAFQTLMERRCVSHSHLCRGRTERDSGWGIAVCRWSAIPVTVNWNIFKEGFSIIASHQAPLSFLDVTISCAVQGGAVTAPLWWLRVHQSPQKQQEKLDRLRGDICQLTRTCC